MQRVDERTHSSLFDGCSTLADGYFKARPVLLVCKWNPSISVLSLTSLRGPVVPLHVIVRRLSIARQFTKQTRR